VNRRGSSLGSCDNGFGWCVRIWYGLLSRACGVCALAVASQPALLLSSPPPCEHTMLDYENGGGGWLRWLVVFVKERQRASSALSHTHTPT
jgi:hypothetical protein